MKRDKYLYLLHILWLTLVVAFNLMPVYASNYPVAIKLVEKENARYDTPENAYTALMSAKKNEDVEWYYNGLTEKSKEEEIDSYKKYHIDIQKKFDAAKDNKNIYILNKKAYKDGIALIVKVVNNDGSIVIGPSMFILENGLWKGGQAFSADDPILDYLDYIPPPYQPVGKIHTWYMADTEFMQKDGTNHVLQWIDKSNSLCIHNAKQTQASRQPLYVEKAIDNRPALLFDGIDDFYIIANNKDYNEGGPWEEKTISVVFQTGDDITSRQVIYEEGGTGRGINLYIDDGRLYANAWNMKNDDGRKTTPWGPKFIATVAGENFITPYIEANTAHSVTLVFDTEHDILRGYLNGILFGQQAGIGELCQHPGAIGLGKANERTRYHDGPSKDGKDAFSGYIAEFLYWNEALHGDYLAVLHKYFREKYGTTTIFPGEQIVAKYVVRDDPRYIKKDADKYDTRSIKKDADIRVSALLDYSSSWLTHNAVQSDSFSQPLFVANAIGTKPALLFDGVDDHLTIPNNLDFNRGGPWTEKTIIIAFQTGEDVTARQMVYEEGGVLRGLNLYIDDGKFYMGAWNTIDDDEGKTSPWGPEYINTPIQANTAYYATLLFDQPKDSLQGFLNGVVFGEQSGIGRLFQHSGGIGLGMVNENTHFHDGPFEKSEKPFSGYIHTFLYLNLILSESSLAFIHSNMAIN